ncbi:MAG: 50S ribosomal protein L17, partial [Deltaproteobacteria bacterium]|nr:50S ribosomal protein L17 [Deltaproteobacteria bacterium]
MRHKRIGRKLGVTTKHRKAMFRNMVTDLFRNERLKTTDTRAKELRRVAEKIITLAKEGTLQKRRQAAAYIRDKEVLKKLFDELAERFKERPGGYTRITKLGFRRGDNTPISIIELVEEEYKPKKKKKTK